MSEAREWWIFKGTSCFCDELTLDDDCENLVKHKPDDFYDLVSPADTIEGGIHVIEYSELEAAQAEIAELKERIGDGGFYGRYAAKLKVDRDQLRAENAALKEKLAEVMEGLSALMSKTRYTGDAEIDAEIDCAYGEAKKVLKRIKDWEDGE